MNTLKENHIETITDHSDERVVLCDGIVRAWGEGQALESAAIEMLDLVGGRLIGNRKTGGDGWELIIAAKGSECYPITSALADYCKVEYIRGQADAGLKELEMSAVENLCGGSISISYASNLVAYFVAIGD